MPPRQSSLAIALCAAAVVATRAALCFALADTTDDNGKQWVQLIPAVNAEGKVQGRDGRWWRMSDPQTVANAFNLALAVDINHASELKAPKGEEAPALGWIEALEVRQGAIWGRIDWNEDGRNAVSGKKYRFLSPVFNYDKVTREIHQITSVALVNDPNFPLALNRAASDSDPSLENPAVDEAIRKALGLPEQATPEQAVTAINSLRSAQPSLDKFVPRETYEIALNSANEAQQKLREHEQKVLKAAIDTEIDAALKSGKITPATVDYYRAQCAAEGGLERFKSFVAVAPVVGDASGLDNRQVEDSKKALNAATKSVASMLGVSEEDIKKYGGESAHA